MDESYILRNTSYLDCFRIFELLQKYELYCLSYFMCINNKKFNKIIKFRVR